jgi:hypothetical protein
MNKEQIVIQKYGFTYSELKINTNRHKVLLSAVMEKLQEEYKVSKISFDKMVTHNMTTVYQTDYYMYEISNIGYIYVKTQDVNIIDNDVKFWLDEIIVYSDPKLNDEILNFLSFLNNIIEENKIK